jgi:ABC-type branched-subunit amino acid transport system substrate-binding protein
VAILATALIAAVACGSSSAANQSSRGSTAPIKVLTYGDITGLFPTAQTEWTAGIQAAVNAFNAKGGIQGRKVKLIECDTELNPAKAASCVENAKKQGVAFAIPSFEILDNITTPLLEKQGIPVFGDPATAQGMFDKTEACFVPTVFQVYPAGATQLAKAGANNLSVIEPAGVANTDQINAAVQLAASAAGAKVGATVGVPITATDLSSISAQATSSGENGSFLLESPPSLFTLIADIGQAQSGIKMSVFGPDLAVPQVLGALSQIPAAKNLYSAGETAWPTDMAIPGVRLYNNEVGKLDKSAIDNEGGVAPWINAWGAMQVLATMKTGSINSATVAAAMKTAKVNFEGIVPNWQYKYDSLGLGCENVNAAYLGVYRGGSSVTPLNDDKPVTALSPKIIAYYKKALG